MIDRWDDLRFLLALAREQRSKRTVEPSPRDPKRGSALLLPSRQKATLSGQIVAICRTGVPLR
jgi:hypothetical protein